MQKENTASGTNLWIKKPLDKEAVKDIAQRYDISLLHAAILLRREIKEPQDLIFFLENSPVFLHNPFLFLEMTPAVERIFSAIKEQEKIAIFGDRDADGICSSVLLLEYFHNHQANIIFAVPIQDEPYGLTVEKVNEFEQQDVSLIICVDNGSSAYEALDAAYKKNIDVIIFDHHTVENRPQHALCFINPQIESAYPNKSLSASALVLKVLFALDFAKSEHFNSVICLLWVYQNEEGIMVETNLVMNLLCQQKQTFLLRENSPDNERFLQVIQGYPLYTFNALEAINLLSSFFSADVYIHDLTLNLCGPLHRLRESTLESLEQNSSIRRFYPKASHTDILLYLYQLTIIYNHKILPHYWQGFDLAGIGLIADMMPMRDENRIIAKMSLKALQNPKKSALVTLFNYLNLLGQKIDVKTISWRIAPLLNASGRMGEADKAVEMLSAQQYSRQEELVQHIGHLNEQRKELTKLWFNKLYSIAQKSYQESGGNYIFIYDPDLPAGQTGLLAGKFGKIFPHSLTLVATNRTQEGQICGSLRTNINNTLLPFLNSCDHLFDSHGGHLYAGGFSAPIDVLEDLQKAIADFFADHQRPSHPILSEEPIFFDAELPIENFPLEIFELVDRLAPYGEKFGPLTFLTREIPIIKIQLIGKLEEHLRIGLKIGKYTYSALWWNHAAAADSIRIGDKIDLLYQVENQKNSHEKILQIIHMHRSDCSV